MNYHILTLSELLKAANLDAKTDLECALLSTVGAMLAAGTLIELDEAMEQAEENAELKTEVNDLRTAINTLCIHIARTQKVVDCFNNELDDDLNHAIVSVEESFIRLSDDLQDQINCVDLPGDESKSEESEPFDPSKLYSGKGVLAALENYAAENGPIISHCGFSGGGCGSSDIPKYYEDGGAGSYTLVRYQSEPRWITPAEYCGDPFDYPDKPSPVDHGIIKTGKAIVKLFKSIKNKIVGFFNREKN